MIQELLVLFLHLYCKSQNCELPAGNLRERTKFYESLRKFAQPGGSTGALKNWSPRLHRPKFHGKEFCVPNLVAFFSAVLLVGLALVMPICIIGSVVRVIIATGHHDPATR